MASRHLELGAWGEAMAAGFLRDRGWSIIGRNVRAGGGEIDILARDPDGAVVAVEVKTIRSTASGDDPLDRADAPKLAAVRRAAARAWPRAKRVDVVGVSVDDDGVGFRWVRDAWWR